MIFRNQTLFSEAGKIALNIISQQAIQEEATGEDEEDGEETDNLAPVNVS